MNIDLRKFLDLIINPESRFCINNYIASRKINDPNLSLLAGYVNGAAWISGIAFDKKIVIRFNYFENSCGFYTTVDDKEMALPLTETNLRHFFTTGNFLPGTYFSDRSMAAPRYTFDMNWYLWEAIVTDIATLQYLKLAPADLVKEADDISTETRTTELFSSELRARACQVEFEISKYQTEIDAHYAKEEEAAINAYR